MIYTKIEIKRADLKNHYNIQSINRHLECNRTRDYYINKYGLMVICEFEKWKNENFGKFLSTENPVETFVYFYNDLIE